MRPKKSLGQNFLKSKQAIVDMIRAANISPGDRVLEIGPGKGVLTEALLEAGALVDAVEADADLLPLLTEKFNEYITAKKLTLTWGDILEINPALLFHKKAYKVVANIPYYITGAILRSFLECLYQPTSMTLLVQKEVAERIVARDGKESILSISVKVYGEPKLISKVSKRYFTPEPKVDSAIISITNINKDNLKGILPENFFEIMKTAFGQKRKTAIKNLSSVFARETLEQIFKEIGIEETARAEDLSLEKYLYLARKLFPQNKAVK